MKKSMLSIWVAMLCAACGPISEGVYEPVQLTAKISHVQPMTGMVLWNEQAANLDKTIGSSIALEFSYIQPCKVVTGKKNGKDSRVSVVNNGIAPIYRDAYVTVDGVRAEQSLRGLLPGEERICIIRKAVAAPENVSITSDYILPSQEIQFDLPAPL